MTIFSKLHGSPAAPLVIFLCAASFGACTLLLLLAPVMYLQTERVIDATKDRAADVITAISTANTFRYGTAQSVDPNGRTITLTMNDHVSVSTHVLIYVAPDSYIARQDLERVGGVYQSISEPVASPIGAIRPGDRVMFLPVRDASGRLTTAYVLFGNPL